VIDTATGLVERSGWKAMDEAHPLSQPSMGRAQRPAEGSGALGCWGSWDHRAPALERQNAVTGRRFALPSTQRPEKLQLMAKKRAPSKRNTAKNNAPPKKSVSSGTAAEYFVAGELLRRGVGAYLSIGAHKRVDILVTADDSITTVDVKAVHGRKPTPGLKSQASWNMPKVEARRVVPGFYYVLVWLGAKKGDYAPPEYFVVPTDWAASKCADNHKKWVAESATHDATSPMRRLLYSDVGAWRERWDLLGV
jgi:hypothetical protein